MSELTVRNRRDKAHDQACEWLAKLYGGDGAEQTRREFEAWVCEDPINASEYRKVEMAWRAVSLCNKTGEASKEDGAAVRRLPGKRFLRSWPGGLAIAASVIVAVFLGLWAMPDGQPDQPRTVDYKTAVAKVRDIALADGTAITLGAKTAIQIEFSDNERRVRLKEGRAFFSVAKDPARPFIVEVDGVYTRVLGTEFDVHRTPLGVRVSVLEGLVGVELESGQGPVRVAADQQVVASREAGMSSVSAATAKAGSWRTGRLRYKGASLMEVIADANRYYPGVITLEDEGLKSLKITTSFRTDQIRQMLASLAATHPVKVVEGVGLDVSLRFDPEEK